MKPAFFVALLALPLVSLSAHANFDPKGELTCHTQNGTKILINDEFAGSGRALVSGTRRAYYTAVINGSNGLSVLISAGQRALAPDYAIRLDTANGEVTTRKEGNEMAQFYYVPAQLVTTNLWSGEQVEAAKCIQAVK
jgi:hypothetical protein